VDGYLMNLRYCLQRCRKIASSAIAEFWNDRWLLFYVMCFAVPLVAVEVVLFISETGIARALAMILACVMDFVLAVVWAPKDS
jgi:hypothetical protein